MTTERTYKALQNAIDAHEDWFNERGIDFTKLPESDTPKGYPEGWKPSPRGLKGLYQARDKS